MQSIFINVLLKHYQHYQLTLRKVLETNAIAAVKNKFNFEILFCDFMFAKELQHIEMNGVKLLEFWRS